MNLPPNQQLVSQGKWPVVGEKSPRRSDEPWTISVTGLAENPKSWSLDELRRIPLEAFTVDIHCVTRWSRPGSRFRGLPLANLLAECRPLPSAKFISFRA